MSSKTLRQLLESGSVVRLPGAYDGLTARIAQQIGFPAVAFSGNAVSASILGAPDVGLLGMAEVVQHAGRIARNLSIPLLCDADTGYGGVLNVVRAPLVAVIQETPPTTLLTDDVLRSVGCAFAIHAGVVRYAVVKAVQDALGALHREGNTASVRGAMGSFGDYNDVLGLDDWLALEQRYLGDAAKAA